ncbi:MAG: polysaccharide pyruvyl transferase family protein [Erysipelotrichaceae bacterium]|nr:polysaccharide pyruvyl transferase family protein [Erysipelotrichaceae bacterium]
MDYFINFIVNLFVFMSDFASLFSKIGLIDYKCFDNSDNSKELYVLLVGYNGARNTGADVRVADIARQLQQHFGKDHIHISIMTLDEDNMRCYFDSSVQLIPFNTIFFIDLFKACCGNQAVILCEGSTLKSKFANALTLYFCEAAGIMKKQHKPCIAYGSEAGEMDSFLKRTVKKLCADTYFIARTQNSLDLIQQLGLKGHLGTDAAWQFDSSSYEQWAITQLRESGWDSVSPLLGIAPINPFWWPVKPSISKWLKSKITGDYSLQFQLWYFFSWSKQRKQLFDDYLDKIALAVNDFATKYACHVFIMGMERLDADACNKLQAKITTPTSIFLSSDYDGYKMAAILRKLSVLVTSRYHAQVLSMYNKVPSVAISMDERLDNIMQDMDLSEHQLLYVDDKNLASSLKNALEYVWFNQKQIKDTMELNLIHYQNELDKMGNFLMDYLNSFE